MPPPQVVAQPQIGMKPMMLMRRTKRHVPGAFELVAGVGLTPHCQDCVPAGWGSQEHSRVTHRRPRKHKNTHNTWKYSQHTRMELHAGARTSLHD
eukprot:364999-Chlamydomonas_euryale.AAC.28